MERTITILLLALTLSACTTINTLEESPTPSALETAVSDTLITHYVIEQGLGYETNPLGFPATIIIKSLVLYKLSTVEDCALRLELDRWAATFWGGATANNVLVALSVWTPIAGIVTGVAAAVSIYQYRNRVDQNRCP